MQLMPSEAVRKPRDRSRQVTAAKRHDAVGHDAGGAVVRRRRPVFPLRAREEVARGGEGRHPSTVLSARVPADVVHVQVGADHEVLALRRHPRPRAGRRGSPCAACEREPAAAVLVVADAGVDEGRVVRRADYEGVHALQEAATLVEETGLEPGAVPLDGRGGASRRSPVGRVGPARSTTVKTRRRATDRASIEETAGESATAVNARSAARRLAKPRCRR
jgi:hypothetical protein